MTDFNVDVLNFGRARNYDTAVALHWAGYLGQLYAGGYIKRRWYKFLSPMAKALPFGSIERLCQRSSPELPDYVCTSIWGHFFDSALDKKDGFIVRRSLFSEHAGANCESSVIVAEQVEALEAFQVASQRGARRVLILTGQSPAGREILLDKEHLRWPPADQYHHGSADKTQLVDREIAEMELADVLLSPSDFVSESLQHYPSLLDKPIFKIDWPIWGSDLKLSLAKHKPDRMPLRVLFVGGLNLRKGVMYLVEALEALPPEDYETRFVGGIQLPRPLVDRCAQFGSVVGHVPYSDMQEHYEWGDVFVLPSLSEGRARATMEAMAAGLPVIVTRNTGAPVAHGENGVVVPARDSVAIAQALRSLVEDAVLYESLSERALETAASLTVERYANQLVSALSDQR